MCFDKLTKFGFVTLLLGIFLISDLNAQTAICNLQFDIFEFNTQDKLRENTVENVNAVLTNLMTEKTIKSSDINRTPLFSSLTSGKYKIEIIKKGYQRRIKEFELRCKNVEIIETISKAVFLQKGNSNEITKFESKMFAVKGDSSLDKPEQSTSTVNGKASSLRKPSYPAAARAVRATGAVNVQVTIDEDGEVITASAVSGHPLLRQAAERAAMESKFAPTMLQGQPVQITGIIVYNFVP